MHIEIASPMKAAIESVDRNLFLPAEFREQPREMLESAPIPLGDGQTVPTKAITELMLELLELERQRRGMS